MTLPLRDPLVNPFLYFFLINLGSFSEVVYPALIDHFQNVGEALDQNGGELDEHPTCNAPGPPPEARTPGGGRPKASTYPGKNVMHEFVSFMCSM